MNNTIETVDELRTAFWNTLPKLYEKSNSRNTFSIIQHFAKWIDDLEESKTISEELACKATLEM